METCTNTCGPIPVGFSLTHTHACCGNSFRGVENRHPSTMRPNVRAKMLQPLLGGVVLRVSEFQTCQAAESGNRWIRILMLSEFTREGFTNQLNPHAPCSIADMANPVERRHSHGKWCCGHKCALAAVDLIALSLSLSLSLPPQMTLMNP